MTDFGERGTRLWENLLLRDPDLTDVTNPAREVAISACYTADRVNILELQCQFAEPIVTSRNGAEGANPLYVEVRNQGAHLARMIAALRLPDVASGKKPQHHNARGVQQPTAMTALERARARAAG